MANSKWPILLPLAKRDVKSAYEWYEEQKVGLGGLFLNRVEECLGNIQHNPKAFQPVGHDARRAVVKQFPYVVFYRIEDKKTYVYAVFHTSQDPKKWMERFEDS